jgi:hypothetical protein
VESAACYSGAFASHTQSRGAGTGIVDQFFDDRDLTGPNRPRKLLGLFALSNMNVAMDKIDGRRGTSRVVEDYGFPDQPMLDEMTGKALDVLSQNPDGFFLMVEGASIDKQAHNMDTKRWILDTIKFDHAIEGPAGATGRPAWSAHLSLWFSTLSRWC